jgi:glycosyltransferase involved in cell wall biosynthesis
MRAAIVIPTFNCEAYVERAIRSARAQGDVVSQIVVVDDGSDDASATIAASAGAQDSRLQVIRQSNHGVAHARNRGYAALSPEPELVLFLDADDELDDGMASTLERHLAAHPDAGMAFCGLRLIDEAGRPLAAPAPWSPRLRPTRLSVRRIPADDPVTPFFSILARAAVLPSASVLRRCVFDRTEGWDETIGQPFEDMNLFLEMALLAEVHAVSGELVRHRRRPAQSTSDPAQTAQQERRIRERWRSAASGDPRIEAAFRDYDHRFVPYLGMRSAWDHASEGRVVDAARFAGGAMRAWISR